MPTPWDAFPPVERVDPKKTGNPWDAFPPADAPMDDSASWQPPEESYQPAPVEQFGPPDLPQYQPLESLQNRDPRTPEQMAGVDPVKSAQVEQDSLRQIVEVAQEDLATGRGREYNSVTRTYRSIQPRFTSTYEKAINEANDRRRVRDLTFQTEDIEQEAARQTAQEMGPFLSQVAATGERLPTGLASIPLRAAGMGAGVDEFARRSAMTSQVANEIGGVGNVLGKGVGTVGEAFLNRGPGKYGAEIAGGAAAGLTTLNETLSRGVDTPTAVANAVVNGLLEGGIAAKFKQLGFGGLESVVAGKIKFGVENFLKETGVELAEENLTTVAQGIASKIVEDVSGRDDLGGLRTRKDFLNAIEDTTLQTLAAMGAGKAANVAADAQSDPKKFGEYIKRTPREVLDFLSGKESLSRSDAKKLGIEFATSVAERAEIKQQIDQLLETQPELATASPEQRVGSEFAAPVQTSQEQAMPAEQFDAEIAQSDERAKGFMRRAGLRQDTPPEDVGAGLSTVETPAVQKPDTGFGTEINKALEELDAEKNDQGYEPNQRELSVDMNKQYGALLDDFEADQQARLKSRMAGDRRQVIVNPHPVTGLIEGKWANQRLAEMSVQRALAQNKPVTYVEGDFHNLGGLNAKFGQTGADRHLKNVTTLFKRFLPENSDVALVHKGGDEYGFHFIGMTADEVRAALDKSKPFIEAYSKKHDLGMVPHTKEGKSGGVGVNYSVVQFDPKKHKADVYTDTQGKPLRLNQAGALIYEADRALEAEKKKHGKVKGQATRTDGGRGEGQRVSQPSVGEAPVSRPAGRQGSVDKSPDAQGKQPSGSGEALSDEASQKRRAALEKRLPGAKITPTKKGYEVNIRGKVLPVEYGQPKVNMKQARQQVGRKLTIDDKKTIRDKARGSFEEVEGTLGKVILREDHGEHTADHEIFHVKKQLLKPEEWKALKKQYGKGAGDKQAEEYIAQAREKWDGSIKGEGDKVFAAMDQESFFDRIGEKPPEPPKTEKASGEPEGRPELANPGNTPEARKVVDVVDDKMGKPERRPQAVEREKAQEAYKADPEAAKKKVLSMDRESMSEQDVHLARIVVNNLTEKALKSGSKTDMAEAVDAIVKYRTGGTETARALAARYDYSEKPAERMKRAVREALLTPPKEYASKIANSTGEAKKAAQKAWSKRVGEIKNALNLQGIDLDNIEGMSQKQASDALNAISAENAGYWDAAYEYWRNAILSAPMTHAVNVTGNTLHTAWNFTAERLVESAINAFRKTGSSGATFGEFKHLYKGLLPGISQGFKNAVMAFKTEQPIFQANDAKTDSSGAAISGLKGKIIRTPQRALLFADEFAKTLIAQMEAGAQAYRIAKKEGLDGVALEKRIAELHTDTNSEAWQAAIDKAIQLTFQEPSKASEIAIKARNLEIGDTGIKPLQYIVPFITTPLNILKIGIMKSPLGSLSLGKKIVENYREGKPLLDGATDKAAQQLIAAAAMWALVSAIKDSDEEWITGTNETAYDPSKPGKSQFTRSVRPPQSVRIGDTWYSYARIEPFATSLSGMVDFAKGGTGAGAKSILGQLEEKTFLKGLADLINVIQQPDSDSARRWATNFTTSWVPNIIRNPARGMRDSVDERSAWGKGELYRNMAVKRLVQGTELPFTPDDMPRYNVWGEELKKSDGDSPNLDVISRMISPVQALKENKFVGARVIMNWNEQNEDKQVWPLTPPKNYKVGKETKYMTEKQYDSYVRETGQELAKRVARAAANWNVEKPTEQNIKWIQEQTENIRSGWRKRNLH